MGGGDSEPSRSSGRAISDHAGGDGGGLDPGTARLWFVYDTYKFVQDTNTRMMGLEGARGDITHLDEVLTMSASMAAATGEVEWIDRYRGFEPKLDAAITQAIRHSTDEVDAFVTAADTPRV